MNHKIIVRVPEGAVRCSVYEAMRALREEKKDICVALVDEAGDAYQVQAYIYDIVTSDKINYSVLLSEMAEYIHNGIWYVLKRKEEGNRNV